MRKKQPRKSERRRKNQKKIVNSTDRKFWIDNSFRVARFSAEIRTQLIEAGLYSAKIEYTKKTNFSQKVRKCVLEMVCKEEVVHWFKGLESHKRIDVMCTLLNMCLPFELRFLGTCLEELGGRDSKELRGIELRVNNSNELAAEIAACQLGDPSDIKVRRKMALYFALIRACNRPCVNELFNTLYSWSNNDFLKRAKGDALQELLLVYTMAANHPVFSFEQRMRCGEIYNKILYGSTESAFTDVPADHNMQTKGVTEAHPSSSNVMMHAKQIPNEQVVYTIQNPVTQINVDQNRGSHVSV